MITHSLPIKPFSPSTLSTDAVYTTWKNENISPTTKDAVTLTVCHLNDSHRSVQHLSKAKSAIDTITQKVKSYGTDLLNAHSGDYNIGREEKQLSLVLKTLDLIGINYSALGNHEFDIGTPTVSKWLNQVNFKTVASNLNVPERSSFASLFKSGKMVTSDVFTQHGHQYGIIGITPPDLANRRFEEDEIEGITVKNLNETLKSLKQEVSTFTQKGINKIILISHGGIDVDKQVAEEVPGIDVILGGHSHTLLDPLEPGKSIFYAKGSKEPTLIFQNGKQADYFGVDDITFNPEGVIQTAVARQEKSADFPLSPEVTRLQEAILGKNKVLGESVTSYDAENIKYQEKTLGNYIADNLCKQTGADLALVPGFSIRNSLPKGSVTTRDVEEIIPYTYGFYTVPLTGKEIKQALNRSAETFVSEAKRPGILYGGDRLKYTLTFFGEAVDIQIKSKSGQFEPLKEDKSYTVAIDTFIAKGGESYFPKDLLKIKSGKTVGYKDLSYQKVIASQIEAIPDHRILLKPYNHIKMLVSGIDDTTKDAKAKKSAALYGVMH